LLQVSGAMKFQYHVFATYFATAIGETNMPGLGGSRPSFQPRALMSQEKAAVCWINAMQFGPFLAQAGLAINSATDDCRAGWGNQPRACATDVLQVVSSLAFTGGFIAAAVEKCGDSPDALAAECAKDISNLIGSVTRMGTGTAEITKECPAAAGWHPYKWVDPAKKGAMIGVCVVDSVQATWYLARAGLLINSAIIECKDDADGVDVDACAARATGIVNSISAAATFIVSAVHQCTYGKDHGTGCAAAALKLVTSLSGIATHALDVNSHCVKQVEDPYSRRLVNATGVGEETLSLPKLNAEEVAHLATLNITEDEMAADPVRVIRSWKFEKKHVENPHLVV